MAKNTKRAWKNERASVPSGNKSGPKSNKYARTSDSSKRTKSASTTRYWRAGYTKKDGTRVKGHYVNKS